MRWLTKLLLVGMAGVLIYVGDGLETRGDLRLASREAAVEGLRIHAIPVGGEKRPDVRVTSLIASDSRLNEGATLALTARVEMRSDSGQSRSVATCRRVMSKSSRTMSYSR